MSESSRWRCKCGAVNVDLSWPREARRIACHWCGDELVSAAEVKEPAQLDQPMPRPLVEDLFVALGHEGPFTDWSVDSELLPRLLAWIGEDWQRLRLLLNYVHEDGEITALRLARKDVTKFEQACTSRRDRLWHKRLGWAPEVR